MKKLLTFIFAILFTLPAMTDAGAIRASIKAMNDILGKYCQDTNLSVSCDYSTSAVPDPSFQRFNNLRCTFIADYDKDALKKDLDEYCEKEYESNQIGKKSESTNVAASTTVGTRTISGTIIDADKETLPGANVAVTGTSNGAATDTDGKFTINNVPNDAKISISYVGYQTQTFNASDLMTNQTITLQGDSNTIEETNVVAERPSTDCEIRNVLPANAKSGTTRFVQDNADSETGSLVCDIKQCDTGFELKDNKCVSSSGPCNADELPENTKSGQRVTQDGKNVCLPDVCNDGFEIKDKKCVALSGACKKKDLPANATSGTRKFAPETKTEICIANGCNDGYKLDDGKCVSELSANRLGELRANATAMKDKEQSDANKLLGGAAIGAAGIGASQFLSAGAEKNADADAERDMSAYLATFRCDYGAGQNIKGGQKGIVLPGGNELMPMYTEYRALAAELKATKQALEMTPGIESETIFDKAETGLYDNESIGRQGGAFSSLSRALSDKTGEDAKEWDSQKSDTASKSKTGAITAGAGIVGGALGNLLINKNAPKESSDKINDKYSDMANGADVATPDTSKAVSDKKSAGKQADVKNTTTPSLTLIERQAAVATDLKKVQDEQVGEIQEQMAAASMDRMNAFSASAAVNGQDSFSVTATADRVEKNASDIQALSTKENVKSTQPVTQSLVSRPAGRGMN